MWQNTTDACYRQFRTRGASYAKQQIYLYMQIHTMLDDVLYIIFDVNVLQCLQQKTLNVHNVANGVPD